MSLNSETITAAIKARALELGFDMAGVCPAIEPAGYSRFLTWLESGYAGEMHYLDNRREAYQHPRHVLEGVRSILVLATNYASEEPLAAGPGQGRVARYAWGTDYHDVLHERLHALADELRQLAPEAAVRGVVDTAPLFERELAELAGLGWIGKNTLLLNKHSGSLFFLSALLTNAELEVDEPHGADHCGTCRACLDACPTDAFVAPYVLDAQRCISYLTIELRSLPPAELRALQQDWVFGCDVCQDVCPWNHRAPATRAAAFAPRAGANPLELAALFELDDAAFRARFRDTPLWRPKRRGLLRNAAIVLGNQRARDGLEALIRGLNDQESLVREACAWALGCFDDAMARGALLQRQESEPEASVRAEIAAALERTGSGVKEGEM